MNIFFISPLPFFSKAPRGSLKSDFNHMAHLAKFGHNCVMVTQLTDRPRTEVLAELKAKGIEVMTEEHDRFFIDIFNQEKVKMIAYTFKTAKEKGTRLGVLKKVLAGVLVCRAKSIVHSRLKNFAELLKDLVKNRKRLPTFIIWLQWYFLLEPFLQEMETYLSGLVPGIRPDFIFVYPVPMFMEISTTLKSIPDNPGCKVICRVSTSLILPFGPASQMPYEVNPLKKKRTRELYRAMDGFITVSNSLENYMKQWSDMTLNVHTVYSPIKKFDIRGPGPHKGYITLINACNEKGLPIVMELAKKRPHLSFAVVVSWGKLRGGQQKELEALPNMRVLEAVSPVDPIYETTRILLVPSLWDEGFGRVVIEAMQCGIPVIASDVGGLPEAKLGIDYIIHVEPYRSEKEVDKVIPQDLRPWLEAIDKLLSSPGHYEAISKESQEAAKKFLWECEKKTIIQPFLEKNNNQ